jgi:serine/threonine-protein phosphatase 6 regulatory ankyrin repeat subunit A
MSMSGGARFFAGFLLALVCLAQENELFDAARRGDLAELKTLAGSRANVELRDAHGRTALHEAAANCQLEAYKLLVESGWDILATDDRGSMPMFAAKCRDTNGKAAFPGPFAASNGPAVGSESVPWSLQYATAHKQAGVISMLLNAGANVNSVGSDGNRALDIACLKGDAASARILLEHGANPNLRNKTGSMPLHDAALSGNKELIEMLLARGADLTAQDPESNSTPLHYAASFGRLDAVRLLVEHGADVSAKNSKGQTALQLAISNQQEEVAAFLRSLGSVK